MKKERALQELGLDNKSTNNCIGQIVFSAGQQISWDTALQYLHFSDHFKQNDQLANAINFKFNNNSSCAWERILGQGRPSSTFYTLMDGKVIIEWGKVEHTSGEAKLHDYLRRNIDYGGRINHGAIVVSGHWGSILIDDKPVVIATLDPLYKQIRKVTPEHALYPIGKTLLGNNIFPMTQDGYPIIFSDLKAA